MAGFVDLARVAGNEVVRHGDPTWDGEDRHFDVRSLPDLDRLPHLHEVWAIESVLPAGARATLEERGIEVR